MKINPAESRIVRATFTAVFVCDETGKSKGAVEAEVLKVGLSELMHRAQIQQDVSMRSA